MSTGSSNYDLRSCPCCGSRVLTTLGEYEICDVCAWEDDPVQSADPDYAGGANKLNLNEARKEWVARRPEP
ncbi:MAG: CPCC family cysteine-rich protein [Verrucomicrobiota bacterium]